MNKVLCFIVNRQNHKTEAGHILEPTAKNVIEEKSKNRFYSGLLSRSAKAARIRVTLGTRYSDKNALEVLGVISSTFPRSHFALVCNKTMNSAKNMYKIADATQLVC